MGRCQDFRGSLWSPVAPAALSFLSRLSLVSCISESGPVEGQSPGIPPICGTGPH
jgi:hypothetical protein